MSTLEKNLCGRVGGEGEAQWRKHQVPWQGMVRKGFLVGRVELPWWSSG